MQYHDYSNIHVQIKACWFLEKGILNISKPNVIKSPNIQKSKKQKWVYFVKKEAKL